MSETTEAVTEKFFKRQELVQAVMEKASLPRPQALAAVEAVFKTVSERLTTGQEVRLIGFGSFMISERKAGKGRDPRTGAEIDVPESKSVRFRAGKALRDSVAGKTVAGDDEAESEGEEHAVEA